MGCGSSVLLPHGGRSQLRTPIKSSLSQQVDESDLISLIPHFF